MIGAQASPLAMSAKREKDLAMNKVIEIKRRSAANATMQAGTLALQS